jgi:hypothetical protein
VQVSCTQRKPCKHKETYNNLGLMLHKRDLTQTERDLQCLTQIRRRPAIPYPDERDLQYWHTCHDVCVVPKLIFLSLFKSGRSNLSPDARSESAPLPLWARHEAWALRWL